MQLKRYASLLLRYSSKRQREVNEIANIIDEDAVYYSSLQKTRWLASRYSAITALEKHFVTTVMHLQHKTGSTGEDGACVNGILKQLSSERFVKHFLMDVTKILSELNKLFQQDSCKTRDDHDHVRRVEAPKGRS